MMYKVHKKLVPGYLSEIFANINQIQKPWPAENLT